VLAKCFLSKWVRGKNRWFHAKIYTSTYSPLRLPFQSHKNIPGFFKRIFSLKFLGLSKFFAWIVCNLKFLINTFPIYFLFIKISSQLYKFCLHIFFGFAHTRDVSNLH
jgi:hypothetical protein